jgi:hypothetical protein
MSDWTQEEYLSILTYIPSDDLETEYTIFDESLVPNAVDWVAAGAVNEIKD